jgi:peptidoglycan/LPS O-acetylase OafA/YrhL
MRERITQLDGLRGYCILAVFLTHALHIRMLWIGVDVFFILSGFLITGILLDAPKTSFRAYIGHFYERRARRILPPYILTMAVFSIFITTHWTQQWPYYLGFTNYLQFHEKTVYEEIGALWSLCVEEQFYLCAPRQVRRIAIALILITPAIRAALTPWLNHQVWNLYHWFVYKSTITRMDELAMGAALVFAWRSHSEWIKKYGYLFLGFTIVTPVVMLFLSRLGGYSTFDNTIKGNTVTYAIAMAAATGAFLWALGGRYIYTLNSAVMRYLGRISYTFYLIHSLFIQVCLHHLHNEYVIAVTSFACSVAFASLSWFLMEKPLLHGGNRRVARQELNAASPHPTPE